MKPMTEAEQQEMAREARIIAIAAPVFMPLLEQYEKIAYEKLLSEYRTGGTHYTNHVAELSVISMLKRKITESEQTLKYMEDKRGK